MNITNFVCRFGEHVPYRPDLKMLARDLRNNPTPAEKKLWYGYLSSCGLKFLRQKPIDRFIVDLYCSAAKLVIEIDGDTHAEDEAEVRDEERTRILNSYGLDVIRFANRDVLNNFESVCMEIDERLKSPNPPLTRGHIYFYVTAIRFSPCPSLS